MGCPDLPRATIHQPINSLGRLRLRAATEYFCLKHCPRFLPRSPPLTPESDLVGPTTLLVEAVLK